MQGFIIKLQSSEIKKVSRAFSVFKDTHITLTPKENSIVWHARELSTYCQVETFTLANLPQDLSSVNIDLKLLHKIAKVAQGEVALEIISNGNEYVEMIVLIVNERLRLGLLYTDSHELESFTNEAHSTISQQSLNEIAQALQVIGKSKGQALACIEFSNSIMYYGTQSAFTQLTLPEIAIDFKVASEFRFAIANMQGVADKESLIQFSKVKDAFNQPFVTLFSDNVLYATNDLNINIPKIKDMPITKTGVATISQETQMQFSLKCLSIVDSENQACEIRINKNEVQIVVKDIEQRQSSTARYSNTSGSGNIIVSLQTLAQALAHLNANAVELFINARDDGSAKTLYLVSSKEDIKVEYLIAGIAE